MLYRFTMAWTHSDLLELDAMYAVQGVALHARPLRAAMDILGGDFIMGVMANPETDKIIAAYEVLVPEVSSTWPGFGIGFAASVDRVRKVTLPVRFGDAGPLITWQVLGFASQEAFAVWCRGDLAIRDEATVAATDMLDIAYGLDSLSAGPSPALTLWKQARSNLEDVANILPQTFSVDTVIQPICMAVELSLKAALVWDGAKPDSFKGRHGHALAALSGRVAGSHPHADDAKFRETVLNLPPYVATRYEPAGLTKLQVVRHALGAQFVVASTVRRISKVDRAKS